jgi:hypothetical protein
MPTIDHNRPLTHAELKYRSMDEHSAQELEAIRARLLLRMAKPRKIRHRLMVDQVYPW